MSNNQLIKAMRLSPSLEARFRQEVKETGGNLSSNLQVAIFDMLEERERFRAHFAAIRKESATAA